MEKCAVYIAQNGRDNVLDEHTKRDRAKEREREIKEEEYMEEEDVSALPERDDGVHMWTTC